MCGRRLGFSRLGEERDDSFIARLGSSLPLDPKRFGSDGRYGPMLMGIGPHWLLIFIYSLGWAGPCTFCDPVRFCPLPSLSLSYCGDTSAAAARVPRVPSGGEAEANYRRGGTGEGLSRRWRRLAPPGTSAAQVLIPKRILDEWNALLGCIHGIGVPI